MTALPTDTIKPSSPPESPTTVRPFDMDDDDATDTSVLEESHPTTTTATATSGAPATSPSTNAVTGSDSANAPPPKPQRPLTEAQKKEATLHEMFPTVELPIIKAILSASRGNMEAALQALLEMTDPDAAKNESREEEDVPPPQPPRPSASAQAQMEADERYARQLAEHYENVSAYEARTANRSQGRPNRGYGDYPPRGSSRQQPQPAAYDQEEQEREYSFIDDDLPAIRDNLRKGFVETQTKVNGWIQNLKKKIDETFDEPEERNQPSGSTGPTGGFGGRAYGASTRRSNDYDRYDADHEVLGDDFAGIKLAPDGSVSPQARSTNVFRPPPPSTSPRPKARKVVGFKEETEDIYNTSPRLSQEGASVPRPVTKASKWQPLTTLDSTPMENDPFSLGDSDDDKEIIKDTTSSKPDSSSKTPSEQDSERLKKAAAEAMADSLVDAKPGAEDNSVNKD